MPPEPVHVFDACAVLAFLHHEEGFEVVAGLLENTRSRRLVHAINACEVYYDIFRRSGDQAASKVKIILESSGFAIESSLSSDLWEAAGRLKGAWGRISLADCFAIALTLREGGTLITTDHHEMDRLAEAKVCPIRFIR